ncbi:MAG: DUF11 domain-containing protein [Caldilineaceae bacterium]|nr:DUF11 domain-containing protein [Caldilineaceae bacterium]
MYKKHSIRLLVGLIVFWTAFIAFSLNVWSAPAAADITGAVWDDANQNGVLDVGENGISGVTVVLYDDNTCQSVQTNAAGVYTFTAVPDGSYTIYEAAGETVPTPVVCPPSATAIIGGVVTPGTITDPAGYASSTANVIEVTLSGSAAVTDRNFGDYTSAPFAVCTEDALLYQNDPSDIYRVDLVTGDYSVWTDTSTEYTNAVGYNVLDDYVYGYSYRAASGGVGYITRTDGDGNIVTLPVPGLTPNSYDLYVGDVSLDGYLYMTNGQQTKVWVVDVNPQRSTYLTVTREFNTTGGGDNGRTGIADWAFNPADGMLYGVRQSSNRPLIRVNPNTGQVTSLGNSGIPGSPGIPASQDGFGAVYFDSEGYFYASQNATGKIYRFDLRDPSNLDSTATFFTQGPGDVVQNDGARCALADVNIDFGDAPDTYGTTLNANGARHILSEGLMMGSLADSEDDGLPGPAADGDDTDNQADEDGLNGGFPSVDSGETTYSVEIDVTNTTGNPAYLVGYMDWNADGDFGDANEQSGTVTVNSDGTYVVTWTIPGNILANPPTDPISTFARFRLSSEQTAVESPIGPAGDGEVEDYAVILRVASITIAKSPDIQVIKPGETAEFTIIVANTGPIELNGITVSDALGPDCVRSSADLAGSLPLQPGANIEYTCSVADVQQGFLNEAIVDSDETGEESDTALVQIAELAITKEKGTPTYVDNDNSGSITLGDTLNYLITAVNTGSAFLNNVTVTDTIIDVADLNCTPTLPLDNFEPDDEIVCTGSYVVTQTDVDNGGVDNTATAGSDESDPDTDDEHFTVSQNPHLAIVKAYVGYTDNDTSNNISAGDALRYSIIVTNDGTVTLDNVTVTDTIIDAADLSCSPATPVNDFAPGDTIECTGSYIVSQDDVDNGEVDNTATADSDQTDPVDDDVTVSIPQRFELDIDKTYTGYTDNDTSNDISVGDTLNYSIVVTNKGNTTLTNVTVEDSLLQNLSCTPVPPTSLAPQGTIECTGSYIVLQSDVNAGRVDNTATASSDETGEVEDKATAPIGQTPVLNIRKDFVDFDDVDNNGEISVNDILNYEITAINDGNVTLTGVTVSDPLLGALTCMPNQPATLIPGAAITCTGSYVVTQADVEVGQRNNTATADSNETDPEEGSEVVIIPQRPQLETDKQYIGNADEDDSGDVSINDTLTYQIIVTNTGNVSLHNVTVSDPMLPSLSCTPNQPAILAPAESITCTGEYTVTQEDVEAGNIVNIATGDSDETEPEDDTNTVPVPQTPALSIDKEMVDHNDVDGSNTVTIGDILTYQITTTNIGNVMLTNVEVSDPMLPSLSCTPSQPAILAPGESIVCTGEYTVTEDDVEARNVLNTATATGESNAGDVDDEDEVETEIPEGPTAISLISFGAKRIEETIEVHWTTDLELDTWGYYLYRSNNSMFDSAQRLNDSIILGKGESGGSYTYVDTNIEEATEYYYWLVEIHNGRPNAPHGPVRVSLGDTQQLFLPIINQ